MSFADLKTQLDQLQEAINQTSQLILKLSKSQSSDLDPDESPSDLAADIRDSLHASEESLELLKQDIDDLAPTPTQGYGTRRPERTLTQREQERKAAHNSLSASCSRLSTDLTTLRTRFRRANLASKKASQRAMQAEQAAYLSDLRAAADAMAASRNNTDTNDTPNTHTDKHLTQSDLRTSLFSSRRPQKHQQQQNKTGTDLLLTSSSDLTLSLRRAHSAITSELSRSRFASETLAASNAALSELNTRYGSLDDLLSRSRGLLGTLLRSQKSDTWFLETAVYLLMGTIAWLLFRRLLYGPLWWFMYLPLKLAYNTIALIVGSGKRKTVVGDVKPRFERVDRAMTVMPSVVGQVSASGGMPSGGAKMGFGAEQGSMTSIVSSVIDSTATPVYATEAPPATAGSGSDDASNDASSGRSGDQAPAGNGQRQQQDQQQGQGQQEVRRSDGTVLRERDPVQDPANPKKRMWEEPVGEGRGQGQRRDEL